MKRVLFYDRTRKNNKKEPKNVYKQTISGSISQRPQREVVLSSNYRGNFSAFS